jgi:hypothetical protein
MSAPNLRRTPRAVSEYDAPIVVNADDFNVMRSEPTTTNGGAIVLDMPKEPPATLVNQVSMVGINAASQFMAARPARLP